MTPRQQQGTEESLLREPGTAERGAAPPKEALLAGIVESSADAIIGWTLGALFLAGMGAQRSSWVILSARLSESISASSFRPNVRLRSRAFDREPKQMKRWKGMRASW